MKKSFRPAPLSAAMAAALALAAVSAPAAAAAVSVEDRAGAFALLAFGEGRCSPTPAEAKAAAAAKDVYVGYEKDAAPADLAERKKLQVKIMAGLSSNPPAACKAYRDTLAQVAKAVDAASRSSRIDALKPKPSDEAVARAALLAILPAGDKACRPSLDDMAASRDVAVVVKYTSAQAGDSKELLAAAAGDAADLPPKALCSAYAKALKGVDAAARASVAATAASIRRGEDPLAAEKAAKAAADKEAAAKEESARKAPAAEKAPAQGASAPARKGAAPAPSAAGKGSSGKGLDAEGEGALMTAAVLAAGRNSCPDARGLKDAALDVILVVFDALQEMASEKELSAKLAAFEGQFAKLGKEQFCKLYEKALDASLKTPEQRAGWKRDAKPIRERVAREAAAQKGARGSK